MPSYNNSYDQQISQEDLRDLIQQTISQGASKLGNLSYSHYPGKTLSPMSSLTQKAHALEERKYAKGLPYKNSLGKLANAPIEGLNQNNIQSILDDLKNKHTQFGQNITGKRLNKQFGQSFNSYQNKYNNKLNKGTDLQLGEVASDVGNLSNNIKALEGKRNSSTFDTINNSSIAKRSRQQALIDNLKTYGQQKHGFNNKILTAEKARFDAEKNEPYENLRNLQAALNGTNEYEDHPDISDQNTRQLKKALDIYNNPVPTYQGKIVEPINADMHTSYNVAEAISPKYQDKNYDSRKQIRKELVNSNGYMDNIVGELPNKLDPKFAALDAEAKRKAKADMTALNAKYIKRGMYGGQSHIKSASNRMNEINDSALGSKSKMMQNELGANVIDFHTNTINNANKLNQYDQLANSEYNNMLGDVKRINNLGIEKWKNDQIGNEQLYKSYQNEKSYQQPKLLSNAKGTGAAMGINSMFGHFENQGVDLNQVSDLQNKYNNLEKENSTLNQNAIKNEQEYLKFKEEQRVFQEQAEAERIRQQKANDAARIATERARQQAIANAKYSANISEKKAISDARELGKILDKQINGRMAELPLNPQQLIGAEVHRVYEKIKGRHKRYNSPSKGLTHKYVEHMSNLAKNRAPFSQQMNATGKMQDQQHKAALKLLHYLSPKFASEYIENTIPDNSGKKYWWHGR